MKKITPFLFLLFLAACQNKLIPPTPFESFLRTNDNQCDIFIKKGNIINGSGSVAYIADILIKEDKIIFIGNVESDKIKTAKTINAEGKTISPGFIDMHAHGDPLKTPEFKNFLAMGVTTICLGQDGSSPAKDLEIWRKEVDKKPLGVNIAMFVGHGTLRKLSGINYSQNPSTAQIEKICSLLQTAFDNGYYGMSTGLEYTPGIYAKETELTALAKVVGNNKGLIMSHIRNEDDDQIEESLKELLGQGEHCNVHVSHLKSVFGKGKERAKKILVLLKPSKEKEFDVSADVYPYNASYTGIGIVFPKWAKAPNDYKKVIIERREELLAFLKQKIIDRNGPEATLFGTAPYTGKTLAQVSAEQGLPYEKVLMGIGPNKASGAYFVMNDALQEEFIADSMIMICSDGSPTMHHPRGYGTFAKIIEEYVFKRKKLSLEAAIRKMTSLSAQTLGLKKRGLLKEGNFADLLIFDPKKIKANATYPNPHQLATGFEWVFVNGKIAWHNGSIFSEDGEIGAGVFLANGKGQRTE